VTASLVLRVPELFHSFLCRWSATVAVVPALSLARDTDVFAPSFAFPLLAKTLSPATRLSRWLIFLAGFFLTGMTLLRVGTYLGFNHENTTSSLPWAAFWLGLRFDARVVASLLLPLLVLGSFRWLDPFENTWARRGWMALLGICSAALIVFYVGDFLHYRYLQQRLNASALEYLQDAKISAGMVWQSYPVVRLGLAIVIAIIAAAIAVRWLHQRAAATENKPRRLARAVWFTALLVGCIVAIFGRVGQYPLRWSDAFNLRNTFSANLALNPVQSFFSSLSFRASSWDEQNVKAAYPQVGAYLGAAADGPRLNFERIVSAPNRPANLRPPNVVLVLCESFSGYKSSMWGNALDTTPFFHELTRQGVFFDNCFTPHVGTARGVWATITGTPDVEPRETASRNPALVDQHTIINDFAGYEKLYFLGGSSSWANIRGLLTNNIDGLKLYEEGSYNSPRIDVWGISDKNLFLEANDVLRTQTKPFFAVIQTADNHRPYTIPKEDLKEFAKVEVPAEALKRGGFESIEELNAFRYTDFAFRKFIEAARKEAYFEDTIFVFIGDHGIGGNAEGMFPSAWTAQNLTRYHVPLLFYAPKRLQPQRVHAVASMVDVLPTIAGLAEISYRNTTLGRDLLRQQKLDGGRSNVAFVIDHNDKSVGVIKGEYFGQHQREGARQDLVWADFNSPGPKEPAERLKAEKGDEYRSLANAFYETSRYLLRHNRKAEAVKGSD
jgi:phosphoglycerol transferase MdoB-like AlkP superfamily enzyme